MSVDKIDNFKGTGAHVSGQWKAPAILFITITVMVFLLIILLPDSPFEFW